MAGNDGVMMEKLLENRQTTLSARESTETRIKHHYQDDPPFNTK